MNTPDSKFMPSKGWRTFLIIVLLLALGVTLAPVGIMILLDQIGINLFDYPVLMPVFLFIAFFVGILALGVKKIFKYVFWIFLGLVLMNISGCIFLLANFGNMY